MFSKFSKKLVPALVILATVAGVFGGPEKSLAACSVTWNITVSNDNTASPTANIANITTGSSNLGNSSGDLYVAFDNGSFALTSPLVQFTANFTLIAISASTYSLAGLSAGAHTVTLKVTLTNGDCTAITSGTTFTVAAAATPAAANPDANLGNYVGGKVGGVSFKSKIDLIKLVTGNKGVESRMFSFNFPSVNKVLPCGITQIMVGGVSGLSGGTMVNSGPSGGGGGAEGALGVSPAGSLTGANAITEGFLCPTAKKSCNPMDIALKEMSAIRLRADAKQQMNNWEAWQAAHQDYINQRDDLKNKLKEGESKLQGLYNEQARLPLELAAVIASHAMAGIDPTNPKAKQAAQDALKKQLGDSEFAYFNAQFANIPQYQGASKNKIAQVNQAQQKAVAAVANKAAGINPIGISPDPNALKDVVGKLLGAWQGQMTMGFAPTRKLVSDPNGTRVGSDGKPARLQTQAEARADAKTAYDNYVVNYVVSANKKIAALPGEISRQEKLNESLGNSIAYRETLIKGAETAIGLAEGNVKAIEALAAAVEASECSQDTATVFARPPEPPHEDLRTVAILPYPEAPTGTGESGGGGVGGAPACAVNPDPIKAGINLQLTGTNGQIDALRAQLAVLIKPVAPTKPNETPACRDAVAASLAAQKAVDGYYTGAQKAQADLSAAQKNALTKQSNAANAAADVVAVQTQLEKAQAANDGRIYASPNDQNAASQQIADLQKGVIVAKEAAANATNGADVAGLVALNKTAEFNKNYPMGVPSNLSDLISGYTKAQHAVTRDKTLITDQPVNVARQEKLIQDAQVAYEAARGALQKNSDPASRDLYNAKVAALELQKWIYKEFLNKGAGFQQELGKDSKALEVAKASLDKAIPPSFLNDLDKAKTDEKKECGVASEDYAIANGAYVMDKAAYDSIVALLSGNLASLEQYKNQLNALLQQDCPLSIPPAPIVAFAPAPAEPVVQTGAEPGMLFVSPFGAAGSGAFIASVDGGYLVSPGSDVVTLINSGDDLNNNCNKMTGAQINAAMGSLVRAGVTAQQLHDALPADCLAKLNAVVNVETLSGGQIYQPGTLGGQSGVSMFKAIDVQNPVIVKNNERMCQGLTGFADPKKGYVTAEAIDKACQAVKGNTRDLMAVRTKPDKTIELVKVGEQKLTNAQVKIYVDPKTGEILHLGDWTSPNKSATVISLPVACYDITRVMSGAEPIGLTDANKAPIKGADGKQLTANPNNPGIGGSFNPLAVEGLDVKPDDTRPGMQDKKNAADTLIQYCFPKSVPAGGTTAAQGVAGGVGAGAPPVAGGAAGSGSAGGALGGSVDIQGVANKACEGSKATSFVDVEYDKDGNIKNITVSVGSTAAKPLTPGNTVAQIKIDCKGNPKTVLTKGASARMVENLNNALKASAPQTGASGTGGTGTQVVPPAGTTGGAPTSNGAASKAVVDECNRLASNVEGAGERLKKFQKQKSSQTSKQNEDQQIDIIIGNAQKALDGFNAQYVAKDCNSVLGMAPGTGVAGGFVVGAGSNTNVTGAQAGAAVGGALGGQLVTFVQNGVRSTPGLNLYQQGGVFLSPDFSVKTLSLSQAQYLKDDLAIMQKIKNLLPELENEFKDLASRSALPAGILPSSFWSFDWLSGTALMDDLKTAVSSAEGIMDSALYERGALGGPSYGGPSSGQYSGLGQTSGDVTVVNEKKITVADAGAAINEENKKLADAVDALKRMSVVFNSDQTKKSASWKSIELYLDGKLRANNQFLQEQLGVSTVGAKTAVSGGVGGYGAGSGATGLQVGGVLGGAIGGVVGLGVGLPGQTSVQQGAFSSQIGLQGGSTDVVPGTAPAGGYAPGGTSGVVNVPVSPSAPTVTVGSNVGAFGATGFNVTGPQAGTFVGAGIGAGFGLTFTPPSFYNPTVAVPAGIGGPLVTVGGVTSAPQGLMVDMNPLTVAMTPLSPEDSAMAAQVMPTVYENLGDTAGALASGIGTVVTGVMTNVLSAPVAGGLVFGGLADLSDITKIVRDTATALQRKNCEEIGKNINSISAQRDAYFKSAAEQEKSLIDIKNERDEYLKGIKDSEAEIAQLRSTLPASTRDPAYKIVNAKIVVLQNTNTAAQQQVNSLNAELKPLDDLYAQIAAMQKQISDLRRQYRSCQDALAVPAPKGLIDFSAILQKYKDDITSSIDCDPKKKAESDAASSKIVLAFKQETLNMLQSVLSSVLDKVGTDPKYTAIRPLDQQGGDINNELTASLFQKALGSDPAAIKALDILINRVTWDKSYLVGSVKNALVAEATVRSIVNLQKILNNGYVSPNVVMVGEGGMTMAGALSQALKQGISGTLQGINGHLGGPDVTEFISSYVDEYPEIIALKQLADSADTLVRDLQYKYEAFRKEFCDKKKIAFGEKDETGKTIPGTTPGLSDKLSGEIDDVTVAVTKAQKAKGLAGFLGGVTEALKSLMDRAAAIFNGKFTEDYKKVCAELQVTLLNAEKEIEGLSHDKAKKAELADLEVQISNKISAAIDAHREQDSSILKDLQNLNSQRNAKRQSIGVAIDPKFQNQLDAQVAIRSAILQHKKNLQCDPRAFAASIDPKDVLALLNGDDTAFHAKKLDFVNSSAMLGPIIEEGGLQVKDQIVNALDELAKRSAVTHGLDPKEACKLVRGVVSSILKSKFENLIYNFNVPGTPTIPITLARRVFNALSAALDNFSSDCSLSLRSTINGVLALFTGVEQDMINKVLGASGWGVVVDKGDILIGMLEGEALPFIDNTVAGLLDATNVLAGSALQFWKSFEDVIKKFAPPPGAVDPNDQICADIAAKKAALRWALHDEPIPGKEYGPGQLKALAALEVQSLKELEASVFWKQLTDWEARLHCSERGGGATAAVQGNKPIPVAAPLPDIPVAAQTESQKQLCTYVVDELAKTTGRIKEIYDTTAAPTSSLDARQQNADLGDRGWEILGLILKRNTLMKRAGTLQCNTGNANAFAAELVNQSRICDGIVANLKKTTDRATVIILQNQWTQNRCNLWALINRVSQLSGVKK